VGRMENDALAWRARTVSEVVAPSGCSAAASGARARSRRARRAAPTLIVLASARQRPAGAPPARPIRVVAGGRVTRGQPVAFHSLASATAARNYVLGHGWFSDVSSTSPAERAAHRAGRAVPHRVTLGRVRRRGA